MRFSTRSKSSAPHENGPLWALAQHLEQPDCRFKPEFFEEPRLPDSWRNLLISPGLALYALLPFWEAEHSEAEALWIAPQISPALLELRAFPICPSPTPQRIEAWLNGTRIRAHSFSSCEEQDLTWEIPARWVRKGANHLLFRFAHAISPQTLTGVQNPDPRMLSVGFRRMWIRLVHPVGFRDDLR